MNVSKGEHRVLHALAQGGSIRHVRDADGHLTRVDCITRDGFRLADCTLAVFAKLKRKRLVASRDGGPYTITRQGLAAVRSQMDNR